MTREKQIEEFANSQIDCEFFDDSLYKGIIIGANWADKNPQMRKDYELLFLLKKQELIKKACEWIKNNKHLHKELSFGSLNIDWDKFIREFRKAMEK